MRAVTDTWLLTRRALRETIRQPANEAVNAFIPLFFYFVTIGGLGEISQQAFGVDDYKGFQVPVALLQGAAGIASGAGLAMTLDIQSGYFEKLTLTSTRRFTIVLGRMLSDAIKSMVLAAVIIAVALAVGSGFETGPAGIVLLVALTGAFALAYSGFGMSLALKTGSPQAAQAGFILFFPLLFLAPTFAPTEVFADWLEAVATVNPVTYILEGMRGLITGGWDALELLWMCLAIGGMGALTFTMTSLALRGRAG